MNINVERSGCVCNFQNILCWQDRCDVLIDLMLLESQWWTQRSCPTCVSLDVKELLSAGHIRDTSESSGPVPAGRSARSGSEWRNETTWWTRCLYFNDIWWPYSQHVKGSAGSPGQTFTSITVLNQVYTHSYCVTNDDSDSVGTSWTSWHHGFKKWPHHTPARLVKKVSSSFYTL